MANKKKRTIPKTHREERFSTGPNDVIVIKAKDLESPKKAQTKPKA